MPSSSAFALACLGACLLTQGAAAQVPGGAGLKPVPGSFGAPADDDFRRPRAESLSAKAFTLSVDPPLPIQVVGVTEQRQITLGRPVYAVLARNVSDERVQGYTLAAVVLGSDGAVKATQRWPAGAALDAGQARRQEAQVRVVVPSISDRIAFVVIEVRSAAGERWTLDETRLKLLLREAMAAQQ